MRREGDCGAPLTGAAAEAVVVVVVRPRCREKGWGWWLKAESWGDFVLPWVLCDQRFRLVLPSLKAPMASPAAAAALERRLARGGEAILWGCEGSGIESLKEADRWMDASGDERELLREGRRP